MRSTHDSLMILLATAEDIVRRGQWPAVLPPVFFELAADIRRIDAQPAEAERVTAAAVMMIIAIEKFFAGPHEKSSPWLMLAGTILPLLRIEAWLAMNIEREARG
jgi:hypothetical protein